MAQRPIDRLAKARSSIRLSAKRRQMHAVAAGNPHKLSIDLNERGIEQVVRQVARAFSADGSAIERLQLAFRRSGTTDALITALAGGKSSQRAQSARMVGALRLEPAVAWLKPLLISGDPAVGESAARALGDIGGVRSSDAILYGIRRIGSRRTFIVALAQAAPDLFLEVVLSGKHRPSVLTAVALAAGLRRKRAAVRPLLALLASGSRRERAASCRALGWIGASNALPVVVGSLADPEWSVRYSAAKTIARLQGDLYIAELEALRSDRDPRVRRAARSAARRLFSMAQRDEWWPWR